MKPDSLPYPDTLTTLGDHIRNKRLDLGLYQKDVAHQLGVKTETVTNWEKNYTAPQLYLIPRVIAFLGYDPISDDSDSLPLGVRVVRARQRTGMTQKDLARRLGVDPTTLARWERGKSAPAPEYRNLLAAFFLTAGPYDQAE